MTTMEFPQCSRILESTGAEVSVFTHDGGRQSFDVTKDGDLYGVGRCAWDVVGIDGRTHDLHRIYPNGHNKKPKIKPDPYAKFEVDAHGNKIIQVLTDVCHARCKSACRNFWCVAAACNGSVYVTTQHGHVRTAPEATRLPQVRGLASHVITTRNHVAGTPSSTGGGHWGPRQHLAPASRQHLVESPAGSLRQCAAQPYSSGFWQPCTRFHGERQRRARVRRAFGEEPTCEDESLGD